VTYYRVNRTFEKIQEEKRLDKALSALEATSCSITDENVDSIVCDLAGTFRSIYKRNAISAASKLLWIRHQAPAVIYDDNAYQFLKKTYDGKLKVRDYPKYRREWLTQFEKRKDCIHSACVELVRVKDFSLAETVDDDGLTRLVGNKWFRERVFDKYLLWNGEGT
jgi:hypothetical protein